MTIVVRPPEEGDLEALSVIDAGYAEAHGADRVVKPGALRFFGRTEHSFVAVNAAAGSPATGFVFAQTFWSGERPRLLIERLVAEQEEAAEALLKAVVKSAYDSGVYDLLARFPSSDGGLVRLLQEDGFTPDPHHLYSRILGSRGQAKGAAGG